MKFVLIPLAAVTLSMTACADSGANYRPILDGPATVGFQSDLAACQGLARDQRQFDNDTMAATVMGAGAGALFGRLDPDGDAIEGAIVGALAGGVSSAVDAGERREDIVVECLRGRGHAVVG